MVCRFSFFSASPERSFLGHQRQEWQHSLLTHTARKPQWASNLVTDCICFLCCVFVCTALVSYKFEFLSITSRLYTLSSFQCLCQTPYSPATRAETGQEEKKRGDWERDWMLPRKLKLAKMLLLFHFGNSNFDQNYYYYCCCCCSLQLCHVVYAEQRCSFWWRHPPCHAQRHRKLRKKVRGLLSLLSRLSRTVREVRGLVSLLSRLSRTVRESTWFSVTVVTLVTYCEGKYVV